MYFTAKIEIDPAQLTVFKKIKPTKLFGKLLDVLSFGKLTERQEHETFTAISILQQLNMGLRSINIKNVVRLAVDDYDFYLDEHGAEDDLDEAMFQFKAKVDPMESELFSTVYLVLEHNHDALKYLVEIAILRKHGIGEYPIRINVNGVLSEFKLNDGETKEQLKDRIGKVFGKQDDYDNFLEIHKAKFNQFVDALEQAILKFIHSDDVVKTVHTEIIRPKRTIDNPKEIRHERYGNPIYYGYYGYDNYFFYSWMWSSSLYSHNIYVNDCHVVDEVGNGVMGVGENGFNAGDNNAFNVDEPFEAPSGLDDVEYFEGSEYQDELESSNVLSDGSDITDTSDISDSGGFDGGDDGGASRSSCGGCGD
ncbi:MAG: hypothetical protein PF588_08410 [Candidatus Kapabacteria bacterium]|jgi:hypothetical protein|nr:hypothetical protein [Candidatus Kapabacteria bacterium]